MTISHPLGMPGSRGHQLTEHLQFPLKSPVNPATASTRTTVTASHSFTRPGTYFPVLRATSQREGNATTPYARIQNLGRVRVVVQ